MDNSADMGFTRVDQPRSVWFWHDSICFEAFGRPWNQRRSERPEEDSAGSV